MCKRTKPSVHLILNIEEVPPAVTLKILHFVYAVYLFGLLRERDHWGD